MHKKMVVVLLTTVALSWAKINININPNKYMKVEPNKSAKIEATTTPLQKSVYVLELTVDSAANQYGVLGVLHDPVKVVGDTVLFVNRALSDSLTGSGYVMAAWSFDGGLNWVKVKDINHIAGVGDGVGRYPTALATPVGPVATFPALSSAGWGYMAAISGTYDDPSTWYGEDGGDQGVYKNISVYMPENQSAFCAAPSASGGVLYGIYDIVNGFYSTTPTALPELAALMGIDYTPGVVHVLGLGSNWEMIDVKYDVASGTFTADTLMTNGSPTQIPGVILPSGDTLDGVGYWDAAVLNDGTPIFIFGLTMSDTTKPLIKQYEDRAIFMARPDTAFFVYVDTSATGTGFVYNEQIMVDKATNAVLIGYDKLTTLLDSNYTDTTSWGIYDVAGIISPDGGLTWGPEVNFTNTPDVSEQMVQFARSFSYNSDSSDAYVYFVYSTPRGTTDPNYDIYYDVFAVDGVTSVYYHIVTTVSTGVAEKHISNRGLFALTSNVVKNAVVVNASTTLGKARIVDLSGRVVKDLTSGLRKGRNVIDVSDLANGIYFLRAGNHASKFIIRK